MLLNIGTTDRRPSERDRRPVARPGRRRRSARPTWTDAHERLVGFLRDLIRIPSINPPDPPGPELDAANLDRGRAPRGGPGARGRRADARSGQRRRPAARRRHRRRSAAAPARTSTSSRSSPTGWTHPPFAADVADGYVWGRGAVDMKAMVALEVGVLRLLGAPRGRRRPRPRPRPDPGPPARRPVRLHRRRGGGRPRRRRLAGRPPARDAPGGRRAERGGRHADRGRRPPVLRDHGRREGLRDVPRSACTAGGATARCRATTTRSSAPPTS